MSRVSLAVLLCATLACTTYAQSGAGDLLKDGDVADGDDGSGGSGGDSTPDNTPLTDGDGGAPPDSLVRSCFAKVTISEDARKTCENSWNGLLQSAKSQCLDATGKCQDRDTCVNHMSQYAKKFFALCGGAQTEFATKEMRKAQLCLNGFDTSSVLDPNHFFDGDLKHQVQLLEYAAKCDALPDMEMATVDGSLMDETINVYANLRKAQYTACVGAKASVKTDAKSTDKAAATEENCDALNVQQQAAVLVQKYVEKARFQEGQSVDTQALCKGTEPTYIAATINKCKQAESVITRAGLQHCKADCGMGGLRKCNELEHSHGKACQTEECQDYLNRLEARHFNVVDDDCQDARQFFDRLTETCPGAKHNVAETTTAAAETTEAPTEAPTKATKTKADKGKKAAATAEATEATAAPTAAAGSEVVAMASDNRPVFMHGFNPLAFMTKYLSERCGGTVTNIPDATPQFLFEYRRIVKTHMLDCLSKNNNRADKCRDQSLAKLRLDSTYPESQATMQATVSYATLAVLLLSVLF